MRIAFVSQPGSTATLPVQAGAIQIWIYEVARRLAQAHDVTVFTTARKGQPAEERHEGVLYRRLPSGWDGPLSRVYRLLDRWKLGRKGHPFYSKPLWYSTYTRHVARAVGEGAFDLVHVMNFAQLVPPIKQTAPATRVVLHMHCAWLTQWDAARVSGYLHGVDRVMACSPHLLQETPTGIDLDDRAEAVPNGVDVEQFRAAPGGSPVAPSVVFIGRLSPEKGLHVLLEAFGRVAEAVPEVRLKLIGTENKAAPDFLDPAGVDPVIQALEPWYRGSYEAHLRRMVPVGLADRVAFLGGVPHPALVAHLDAAAVLVNPSLSESFGVPLIEAMAVGKPVVASRVGGMAEIVVDGQTGLLVERGNPDALAEALIALLTDPELARAFGEAGRARVLERYQWPVIVEQVEQLYREVYTA